MGLPDQPQRRPVPRGMVERHFQEPPRAPRRAAPEERRPAPPPLRPREPVQLHPAHVRLRRRAEEGAGAARVVAVGLVVVAAPRGPRRLCVTRGARLGEAVEGPRPGAGARGPCRARRPRAAQTSVRRPSRARRAPAVRGGAGRARGLGARGPSPGPSAPPPPFLSPPPPRRPAGIGKPGAGPAEGLPRGRPEPGPAPCCRGGPGVGSSIEAQGPPWDREGCCGTGGLAGGRGGSGPRVRNKGIEPTW